jgi:hypothetical protein
MTFGVIVPHRSIVDCFENFIPGVRFVQVKSLFEFGTAGLLLVFLKNDAELLCLQIEVGVVRRITPHESTFHGAFPLKGKHDCGVMRRLAHQGGGLSGCSS